MVDVSPNAEALYYATIASLDELSFDEQKLVVMNWVKYVMTMSTNDEVPITSANFELVFSMKCLDFGTQVMMLPDKVASGGPRKPCGMPNCPGCKKRAEGVH